MSDDTPQPLTDPEHEREDDPEDNPYRRYKRFSLVGLVIWAACLGVLVSLVGEGSSSVALDLIIGLSFAFLLLFWCHADALERGGQLGRIMTFALVLVGVIAFPLYILKTRGLSAFPFLVRTVLFSILIMVVCLVAALASYGVVRVVRSL